MNKEFIEEFAGTDVKITMMDDATFEGLSWFVRFENEDDVFSISIDSGDFEFLIKIIKNLREYRSEIII